jgi:hypothetical protein
MIFSYLNPLAFVLAFGVGLLFVYITNPKIKVVIKFPTPLNAGKVIYRDNGECYKYKVEEVDCDSYSTVMKEQPFTGRVKAD